MPTLAIELWWTFLEESFHYFQCLLHNFWPGISNVQSMKWNKMLDWKTEVQISERTHSLARCNILMACGSSCFSSLPMSNPSFCSPHLTCLLLSPLIFKLHVIWWENLIFPLHHQFLWSFHIKKTFILQISSGIFGDNFGISLFASLLNFISCSQMQYKSMK